MAEMNPYVEIIAPSVISNRPFSPIKTAATSASGRSETVFPSVATVTNWTDVYVPKTTRKATAIAIGTVRRGFTTSAPGVNANSNPSYENPSSSSAPNQPDTPGCVSSADGNAVACCPNLPSPNATITASGISFATQKNVLSRDPLFTPT